MDTLIPLTAAAVSTSAVMYPVDVIRALKLSNSSVSTFYKSYGIRGFLGQGVVPELVKSSSMRISKFFLFPILCETMWSTSPKDATPLQKGLAGGIATIPEILMISPMEIAKIRLQLDPENKFKNDSRAVVKHIYKTRGINGLYSGWAGMQWRQFTWTGTYFATLQMWKDAVEPPLQDMGASKNVTNLVSGFLAGLFATTLNIPGDVVRSMVQKKAFLDPNRPVYGVGFAGVVEHIQVAKEMIKTKGVGSLYQGAAFKALHLGGSGALMAMLVPIFAKLFGIKYGGV
eukprot:TRINITY_DN8820_c0_g1_i1.p1 TRINITY_DN8820_c0_g1~~TRINITY_DN8820_c0_g1_i1.p1  ORF type:complete len:302 (-),score=29.76 TRINITY_DN8820_c0_g1_i1:28-888(-)